MNLTKYLLQRELDNLKTLEDGSPNRTDILAQMRTSLMIHLDLLAHPMKPKDRAEQMLEIADLVRHTRQRVRYLEEHPDYKGNNLDLITMMSRETILPPQI